LCALRVVIVQQFVAILVLARTYSRPWPFAFRGRNEKGWGMSSYATYCQGQAADCGRRARLARSPEIAVYCRSLELRWMRLAQQAQETGGPSWTHQGPLGQATSRRLINKARPSDVRDLRASELLLAGFHAHPSVPGTSPPSARWTGGDPSSGSARRLTGPFA
jgi:hypothetical protein